MSAKLKQLITVDAAATELWRIAESGEVDELRRLLPRVSNVNVCNRYGTTALMKAAYYGHEPMVRALLEHGADPNLTRNDKFTALALAAFFGHGETVRTLVEYGARPEVVTRCGASAGTWARVRTFAEVAGCLEAHSPKPVVARVAPVTAPVAPITASVAPVTARVTRPVTASVTERLAAKTLKDPPEIWDLVHEVPRDFNARSAFVTRLTSMRRTAALSLVAGVLLILCASIGALVFRSSQRRNVPATPAPPPSTVESKVSEPLPAQAAVENPPAEVVNDNHARVIPNKARSLIRQPRVSPAVSQAPSETVQSREAPAVSTPQFESSKPAQPAVRTNPVNPLSPHLISPAKNAPVKAKVIQWP